MPKKFRVLSVLTAGAALICLTMTVQAADSICKGLENSVCVKKDGCGWVKSFKRKDKVVKGFCRKKRAVKAKAAS